MASRRDVLRWGGRSAAWGLPLLAGLPADAKARSCDDPIIAANDRPLKEQAQRRGLLFGAAADRNTLEGNPRYAEAVAAECSMITPENSMKMERLRPAPKAFDFEHADWLVTFAEENGLLVHGHTLVWHLQLPGWLEEVVTKHNAERYLADHIQTVASRYAGRVRSWDVVNEAIEAGDGRGDGLRLSPWLRYLGTDYIELAFHMTRQVELNADLVYNDYGLEYEGDYFEQRRNHVLDLLAGLVAKGVPVDALGIQSHLSGDRQPNFERFARFLDDVRNLGLDIMITELDVRDRKLPADPAERDCRVADTYRAYLDVVLDNPNLRSIAVWGLSDRYSWLTEFEPRNDGKPVRPLPLDGDLKRKPAWHAISNALGG